MRITRVELGSADVYGMASFYGEVIGLPIARRGGSIEVRAGASVLAFRATGEATGAAHFAFNVPPDLFERAQEWLGGRIELLDQPEGGVVAEFERWQARAVYALGPGDNIIEFIARKRTEPAGAAAFDAREHVRCISEIGLVVDEPQVASAELRERFGIDEFEEGSDEFCALGDDEGLLILSKTGRAWRPVEGLGGAPVDVVVELSGVRTAEWRDGGQVVRAV